MSRVSLNFGEVHPYWDASLSPRMHRDAGVSREVMSSISVRIDEQTGEIELNEGYAPGSEQNRQETALYAEGEADIQEAFMHLLRTGRLEDPCYDAFRERHSPPSP